MAAAKTSRPRRAYKKRVNRYNPKSNRKYRPARNLPDFCSLSEEYTFANAHLVTNQMYLKKNFQLADFQRARTVASAYQHYRMTKITMRFKPQIDTYAGGSGFEVPNLYYIIDKSGSIPDLVSPNAMKSMGAKPHRLDDKTVTVSWRPSVLTSTATAPGVDAQTQYKISPWLSTSANTLSPGLWTPSLIDHLGIQFFAETGGANVAYSVDVIVEFQFKKPLNASLVTPNDQQPIIL